MRIFNLELKNIGPFKSAACTFRDEDDEGGNVTIITGLNGTGKSVIIDAIRSLLLGPYSTEIERNIIQDKNDFLIKASVNYGQKTFELIGNQLYHDRGIQTNDIDLYHHIYSELKFTSKWILDYWSSRINRDSYKIESIKAINPKTYLKKSLIGNYTNSDITQIICFLDYLSDSQNDKERALGGFLFKNLIEILNSCLTDSKFSHVSRSTLDPIISTQYGEVTLDKLSSGNLFLIQKMMSLLTKAYSVYSLYGGNVEDIFNIPGLLLIDEAENHLHPDWQKKLLNNILHFFPNLQIILTTHSPFIVSSIEKARILVTKFENGSSTIIDATDDYSNMPIEEILRTSLFDTNSFNTTISDLLLERKKALSENNDKKVKNIEEELKKINPEYFSYLDLNTLLSEAIKK